MSPLAPSLEQITSVDLAGTVTPDVVDRRLYAGDEPAINREHVVLNMSDTRYVDVGCLIQICAALRQRAGVRRQTSIRLPRDQRVRDFFRAWNLQNAIRVTTGIPFHSLVEEADLRYFGEKQVFYLGSRGGTHRSTNTGEAYQRLLSERFFGLTPYVLDPSLGNRTAIATEWNRWRGPYVMSVLKKHLKAPQEEVPRVVIYELISNALQHPRANVVVTASRAVGIEGSSSGKPSGPRQFTICVWDDGQGISTTLSEALNEGRIIRSHVPKERDRFIVKALNWDPTSIEIDSDSTPKANSDPEEFLIASLFSGVSQRADEYPTDEAVGSGLFGLYRSVIDTLGGTLSMRSGLDFINVKAAKGSAPESRRYSVKAVRIGTAPFLGNLVVVRLPLQ